jgi:hypothetical protein
MVLQQRSRSGFTKQFCCCQSKRISAGLNVGNTNNVAKIEHGLRCYISWQRQIEAGSQRSPERREMQHSLYVGAPLVNAPVKLNLAGSTRRLARLTVKVTNDK